MRSIEGLTNVIGYIRVSSEKQEDNQSLDAQERRFYDLAKRYQWKNPVLHTESVSGTTIDSRPVFSGILQDIEHGSIDALWVHEFDRATRPDDLGDLSRITKTLTARNTLFIVDSQVNDLTDRTSRLMFNQQGLYASYFREQLLANTKRGKDEKAAKGLKAGGRDVFGYISSDGGKYHPNPVTAPIVATIYALALNRYSIRDIAAELHKRGAASPTGNTEWSVSTLRNILSNEVYTGKIRYAAQSRKKDTDGSIYMANNANPIVVEHAHQPIISAEIFSAVRRQIFENRKKYIQQSTRYMATGILLCPTCGSDMSIENSPQRSTGLNIPKYTCRNNPKCRNRRIPASEVHTTLWNALIGLITRPDNVHKLIPRREDTESGLKRKLAELQKEQDAFGDEEKRLLNLYLKNRLPENLYLEKRTEHTKRAEQLRRDIAETTNRMSEATRHAGAVQLVSTLRILAKSAKRFTEAQKTALFHSLVEEARLTPKGVELDLLPSPIKNTAGRYLRGRGQYSRQLPVHDIKVKDRLIAKQPVEK